MNDAPKAQMLRLWRETLRQCRETLNAWRETDFRVRVNGIDITDAERAATEARIEHLQKLIAAVEADKA